MKNILMYTLAAFSFAACTNSPVEFPDYKDQAVFFPVQYPVRTLVLGETQYDNPMDRERSFTIAVNIAGMFENTEDRVVKIKYAPEVVNNSVLAVNGQLATTIAGDTIQVLPPNYYTPDLSTIDQIIIPAGSYDGRIRIQLKDEFFNDPKTVGVRYVIPLIILPTTKDSVLRGIPARQGVVDRLKNIDWTSGFLPMDFTLYGIKYTNRFHGNYFIFGKDSSVLNNTATLKRYGTPLIENNTVVLAKTSSLTENTIDRLGGTNTGVKYTMKLKIGTDNSIAVISVAGSVTASGTGKFIPAASGGRIWGGIPHNTMVLDYNFIEPKDGSVHYCKDTLVYRSNGIIYQDFQIKQ